MEEASSPAEEEDRENQSLDYYGINFNTMQSLHRLIYWILYAVPRFEHGEDVLGGILRARHCGECLCTRTDSQGWATRTNSSNDTNYFISRQ